MNIARAIKEGTVDAGIGLENVQMCEVCYRNVGLLSESQLVISARRMVQITRPTNFRRQDASH